MELYPEFFFARGNKRRDQNEAEAVVSNRYNEGGDVSDKQDSSFRYRYLKLIEDLDKRRRGEEMRLRMTFRAL